MSINAPSDSPLAREGALPVGMFGVGHESVLKAAVGELVYRTCPMEYASPVGVGEEAHESPW